MASLADRISMPGEGNSGDDVSGMPPSPVEKPPVTSWADEASSAADANSTPVATDDAKKETSDLADAQTDGATGSSGGFGTILEPTFDVNIQLADLQANPNDPLYSAKSFEELELDEKILKGIYQMRFTKPSKIQERALPLLIRNPPQNLIAQSQSGTGKTAAFVLNILSRLDINHKAPQALVLAPSRELARQILGVVQVMGKFMEGLVVDAAIPSDLQNRKRQITAHVVVGTPGTTMDLIRRRQLDARGIKVLVLDEADNMLDQQGLGDQCHRVRQLLPPKVQVVLFSATFVDEVVTFAMRFAPNANQITLKHQELTVDGIKQLYLECPSEAAKYDALVKLYGLMTIGSSIIFVRTRVTADEIQRRLNEEGHKVASLTGAYDGPQRDVIIDSFRKGESKVLIATNVLSRGIDVQTVSLVVNYDLPDNNQGGADPETYLHRIGRTGRFGRVGVSISLLSGAKSAALLQQISDYFRIRMTALPANDWDAIEEVIKKTIKSSRARADFTKGGAGRGAQDVDM